MSDQRHRNWEEATPEVEGRYYFSGTLDMGSMALSFEPHSILVDVWPTEAKVYRGGMPYNLSDFKGKWLGPVTEEEVQSWA